MASEFPPPNEDVGQPPAGGSNFGRPPVTGGGGMIGRIQRLLLKPNEEWPAIEADPMTVQGILTGWVAPLAAIGPIARLIQSQVFPVNFMGVTWRPPVIGSVVTAILGWLLAIVLTYVWALIIDALAPSFGGTKNPISALKVAAYSATAGWLAAILGILPFLGMLAIIGLLYNIYLLWIGGPMLMKVPQDKAPGFVVVSIVVGFVAAFVSGLVAVAIGGAMFAMTPGAGSLTTPSGTVTFGGTTIDTGKLSDAADKLAAAGKAMEANTKGVADGSVKAVDPNALSALLPGSITGWTRTETANGGGGAMGINASEASAVFTAGDQRFTLKITDTTALGGLAGIVNTTSSRQTATGYEKTELIDGRMTTEKWQTDSKSGEYGVLVGKRFMVEAEGSAPSIDVLKAAVASVSASQLESMAK